MEGANVPWLRHIQNKTLCGKSYIQKKKIKKHTRKLIVENNEKKRDNRIAEDRTWSEKSHRTYEIERWFLKRGEWQVEFYG